MYSTEAFEAMAADVMRQGPQRRDHPHPRRAPSPTRRRCVTLDKQGRVTVDEKLRTLRPTCSPSSKVVVAGAFDRAEVWSEELYERIAADGRGELAGGAGMSACRTPFAHRPVMLDEIVAVFAPVPAGVVLDATLGGGGHSEALLESRPDLSVLGVDRDPDALAAATARLERFGDRFRAVHARFDDLDGS